MSTPAPKAPRIKIGAIREVIRFAAYVRHDRTGGTPAEFRRAQVGPELRAEIAKLQALQIPPRFANDIQRRDDEVRYCLQVIERWEAAKAAPEADIRTCREGGSRHVFLGGPVCILCSVPFVAAPVTRQ